MSDDVSAVFITQLAYGNISPNDLRTKPVVVEGTQNLHAKWNFEFLVSLCVHMLDDWMDWSLMCLDERLM